MRKHIAKAVATVAIAWLGGNATAGDPVSVTPQQNACAPCAAPASKGGWYASAGILYLQQDWTRNLAYESRLFDQTPPPDGPLLVGTVPTEFTHDRDWSGRVELGWKDCSGLGIRGRFFWIDDSTSLSFVDNQGFQESPDFIGLVFNQISGVAYRSAAPLGVAFTSVGTDTAPSLFTASSSLRLQSWDLEMTSDCNWGCLELTWSAGLRYLHIAQSYNASDRIQDPASLIAPAVIPVAQVLTSGHNHNAFGPIIGVEGRYPIGSSLKAFGGARFGILYSEGKQSVLVQEIPLDPANYQPLLATSYGVTQKRCTALPVGDLEMGAEWSKCIGCNGPELFVRGSTVIQAYWGAGRSARVNFNNNPESEDLFLHGFSVMAGIRY